MPVSWHKRGGTVSCVSQLVTFSDSTARRFWRFLRWHTSKHCSAAHTRRPHLLPARAVQTHSHQDHKIKKVNRAVLSSNGLRGSKWRRNKNDTISSHKQHFYLPLLCLHVAKSAVSAEERNASTKKNYLNNFLVSSFFNFYNGHSLVNLAEYHIQMLIISLRRFG